MKICSTHYQDPAPLPVEQLDSDGYAAALAEAQRELGQARLAPLDAVIQGVAVRLHSNNPHWRRFWAANWFSPQQWAALTGAVPASQPQVQLYALASTPETLPWAGYNAEQNSAFLEGDVPYGPLRTLTLAAAAHLLAQQEAAHMVTGLCVKLQGRGTLVLRAPGVDLASALQRLAADKDVELIALDGVLLRYGLVRMVDGVILLPTNVIDEKGSNIQGYRLFPWLEAYGYQEPRADAYCLTLQGEQVYCFARDLDLGRAPEIYAYPVERAWYVPTQLVAVEPDLMGVFWPGAPQAAEPEREENCGGLENVPAGRPDLLQQFDRWATATVSALNMQATSTTRALLQEIGPDAAAQALSRLRAFSGARAIAPPQRLWPGRTGGDPQQPVLIERVLLLDDAGLKQPGPDALVEQSRLPLFAAAASEMADTLEPVLRRALLETGR